MSVTVAPLASGATVQTYGYINASKPKTQYAEGWARGLGIASVVLGGLSICFFIPIIVYRSGMYEVGHGIWCGALVVTGGGLTIGAASKPTWSLVVSSLVLNIISSAACVAQIIIAIIDATTWYEDYANNPPYFSKEVIIMMHTFLALMALAALVISIIVTIIDGKMVCTCNQSKADELQGFTYQNGQVFFQNGQLATSCIDPTQPMVQPMIQPMVQPMIQPMAQQVAQPMAQQMQSVAQPLAQTTAQPMQVLALNNSEQTPPSYEVSSADKSEVSTVLPL